MIAVVLAAVAVLALALMIFVEVRRLRASKRTKLAMRNRRPRRQPLLEDRVRPAFEGPRSQYGEIFVSYHVWKRENETRLELFSGPPWLKLNEFTRALIVRHLWRALESLVQGSVVVVDAPPQTWSKRIDASFDDRGVDPWALARPIFGGDGPQYVNE
jgi:hypothetical protein